MPEPGEAVRCTKCGRVVPVDPEWRIVVCPACGEVINRMASDARYD